MITESTASLVVVSEELPPERVTQVLGIEPSRTIRKGEPRSAKHPEVISKDNRWILDIERSDVPTGDQTGFGSVAILVDRLLPYTALLTSLRPQCETVVTWGGFSNSSEGGFVIPLRVLAGLAALECDSYGTAYLADDGEPS
ncbi:MAG TPA: DUF4279 domain-containing protein [Terrimesophilobacter sp.]|nr:DUF4279 domain-containing protein [Terrimesophilobacter sp.]